MYGTNTASVDAKPPPPHAATKPITRTPPPGPYGDLPANPGQGDSSLLSDQLHADGHVPPDDSVHPRVPLPPEQHHGPPPHSTYSNLTWQQPGYATASPYGCADTSWLWRGVQLGYTTAPSPALQTRMMRLQSLKKDLLPVHRELEVAIPLLLPWPPPVLLDLSAIQPGVYNHLPEGFKGGREISDILYSLFISDPLRRKISLLS